jgi:hypothetical protein
LDVSVPPVDLAVPFADVLAEAAGGINKLGEWLTGLDPRGHLDTAIGRIDLVDHTLELRRGGVGCRTRRLQRAFRTCVTALRKLPEPSMHSRLRSMTKNITRISRISTTRRFTSMPSGELLVWFKPGYLALLGRNSTRLLAI